jgi:hypothetical protein
MIAVMAICISWSCSCGIHACFWMEETSCGHLHYLRGPLSEAVRVVSSKSYKKNSSTYTRFPLYVLLNNIYKEPVAKG